MIQLVIVSFNLERHIARWLKAAHRHAAGLPLRALIYDRSPEAWTPGETKYPVVPIIAGAVTERLVHDPERTNGEKRVSRLPLTCTVGAYRAAWQWLAEQGWLDATHVCLMRDDVLPAGVPWLRNFVEQDDGRTLAYVEHSQRKGIRPGLLFASTEAWVRAGMVAGDLPIPMNHRKGGGQAGEVTALRELELRFHRAAMKVAHTGANMVTVTGDYESSWGFEPKYEKTLSAASGE